MYYGKRFKQPTIAELKEKARKNIKKGYEPIILESSKITTTWWGKKWCENLESYADFASRISRGKKYVKANAVLDLKIEEGVVKDIVQGSRKKPYNVTIVVEKLS